jgi:hypothetical protein
MIHSHRECDSAVSKYQSHLSINVVNNATSFISVSLSILIVATIASAPVIMKVAHAQELMPILISATTGNNISSNKLTSTPTTTNGAYQGTSIKLFMLDTLVRSEQWNPVDNYVSQGWDIKVMLPLANETKFLIVLQKEPIK